MALLWMLLPYPGFHPARWPGMGPLHERVRRLSTGETGLKRFVASGWVGLLLWIRLFDINGNYCPDNDAATPADLPEVGLERAQLKTFFTTLKTLNPVNPF